MRDHYIANHEAGHQEGCAHAVYLRLPKAEQVFEVLLRVGAFSVKLTVKGGTGNRPVHDVVGALVADGEAPPAAFVLLPQTALDHDGSSGIHAPDDGSVTDEERMAAQQEMRDVGQKLRAVAQQEREILLNQTARSFGVNGEAGKELVETVKQVYQATESWGGFGRGHGGRR